MDTNCLKPIELIVTHSKSLDVSIIRQTFDQLLESPVDSSATVPDLVAYVHTLTTTVHRLIEEKDENMEHSVIAVWKCFIVLMKSEKSEIPVEIAPIVAMFMTSLKPVVNEWSDETAKVLLEQSKSLLVKLPKDRVLNVCLVLSAVIQTCGPSKPEQLMDMAQEIMRVYDRSKGYVE